MGGNDNIILDKELGLNPRLIKVHCFICGQVKDEGILLLGNRNYRIKCSECGTWNVGGLNRLNGILYECCNPNCKQQYTSVSRLERVDLDKYEHIEQNGTCSECLGYMEQGIVMISVKDDDVDSKNPYRTGGWVVMKEEAVERMIDNIDLLERIKKQRMAFVPDTAWDAIGLPRQEEDKHV